MLDESEVLTIKTMGAYFQHENPPFGVWTAGLVWNDEEVGPMYQLLNGKSYELDDKGHNIGADVMAVLAGLREAQRLRKPAEVHSVNQSVVRTIPEWFEGWKSRKWVKSDGKQPDCLEEWQEIAEITRDIEVTWHKRKSGPVDTIRDYEAFERLVEERDNDFWMQRAIDRDPWG